MSHSSQLLFRIYCRSTATLKKLIHGLQLPDQWLHQKSCKRDAVWILIEPHHCTGSGRGEVPEGLDINNWAVCESKEVKQG